MCRKDLSQIILTHAEKISMLMPFVNYFLFCRVYCLMFLKKKSILINNN